ncbi:MAG: M24 family metallopeptidase [Eubacteriales bacterium]|nr:M24 family metallopeptidase [Eubacteriales bacterium]
MREELIRLRNEMEKAGVSLYIACDCDDHLSEYVDDYYKSMKFVSGFTGGDGTLVVTMDEAALWTDGRYFIQAAIELKDSGIELMKMGEPDCPDMYEWISEKLPKSSAIGFDGRCIPANMTERIEGKIPGISFISADLVGRIWDDRPAKTQNPVMVLKDWQTGRTVSEKLKDIRDELSKRGADSTVISACDDIAWTLNMRGSDIAYNPVFASFLIIDTETATLFITGEHLTGEAMDHLAEAGVRVENDTEKVYEAAGRLSGRVLVEKEMTSYEMLNCIRAEKVFGLGAAARLKNFKNATEMDNIRKAQIEDSIAVTRYMYFFKHELLMGNVLTECTAAARLHELRTERTGFNGESFPTISAYGENAAMCHYEPDESRDVVVEERGLYLCDSGGHYDCGTTDITRTWACGPLTDEERKAYTLVAIGNLRLAAAVFPRGTAAITLDYAARKPLWDNGMNFNHGTGHGVGYILNVHERPAGIRYRSTAYDCFNVMDEGVYVSDEPGYYAEGKFGIRLENMLLCVNNGGMCGFETVTFVPFDSECIDVSLMSDEDIRLYNEYHSAVYEKIVPHLCGAEREWLKEATAPIARF